MLQRLLGIVTVMTTMIGASEEDKPPRSANRLGRETSPYLLMHAHNPVDWYGWGTDAFTKAKKENKLIFLSIGYSSCYWCHVMERESFQNAEVAKQMNEMFVCIKVDREERPDIDSIYMASLGVIGQRGGWPLSMFLTPDAKPIVGGTYWPAEDRMIEGQKVRGFKSIMKFMRDWYAEKPDEVKAQADEVGRLTRLSLQGRAEANTLVVLDRSLVTAAIDGLKEEFDSVHGGFGSPAKNFKGTKFPVPPSLNLILHEARRSKSPELANMLTLTLDHMAKGGIYDQIGGGFHRYSTERTWTVPHFEKMLYDNAQLVETYSLAYRLTRDPLYERIVRETLAYVRKEMTSPEGGFYSALDAETDGEEGRFYVWTPPELHQLFDKPEERALVQKFYGTETGVNFEGKYHILVWPKSIADVARELNCTADELRNRLEPLRQRLLDARAARPRPFLDTKILASWNGQMIAGYAVAGEVFSDSTYIDAAVRAANLVLQKLRTGDGRLLRTYGAQPGQAPEAKLNGYVEDYAYLVHGLLCLSDATGDPRWLNEAKALTDTMVKLHGDSEHGGFYYTSNDHEELFARAKDQYDSVQPSGNSAAAANLVRLWIKTGDESYRVLAEKTIRAFAVNLKANPTGLPALAHALALYLDRSEGAVQADDKKETGQGGAKKSDSVVKAKAVADKIGADGQQVVTLTLKIDDGWHLYANPVPEDFPGIPVAVTVDGKTKPKDVKVEYPTGTLVKDPLAGDHRVYEKEAKIKVTVKREAGDAGPLDFSIKVQSCSKQTCLVPGVIKLTVP